MEKVKYAYIRDQRCPQRVLTVARTIVGNEIHFGFAMNKVVDIDLSTLDRFTQREVVYLSGVGKIPLDCDASDIQDFSTYGVAVAVLDKFDRRRGRTIAEGRMLKNPYVLSLVDGESPHLTVLKGIAAFTDKQHRMVKRVAAEEVDFLEYQQDVEGKYCCDNNDCGLCE